MINTRVVVKGREEVRVKEVARVGVKAKLDLLRILFKMMPGAVKNLQPSLRSRVADRALELNKFFLRVFLLLPRSPL